MLRVAEHHAFTDTGQQRRHNEDAYYARTPVFAVADGMGGAQAGEVASHAAVEAVAAGLPEAGTPEDRLAAVVRRANEEIFRMSREDDSRAGMGTTLTAVHVGESDIAIAHVGDSRAYRFRDGELSRLTEDHSLVEEMRRRGQLTAEEADEHPQRSIITRALGPEPDVLVDTRSWAARDGDVILLCSDGLTSMISEAQVAEILREAGGLEQAGRALIAAANRAGGRDNITVVLLRLEEVGRDAPAASDHDQPTEVHDLPTQDGGGAPTAVEARPAVAQATAPAEAPARRRLPRRARKDDARAKRPRRGRRGARRARGDPDRARPGRDRRVPGLAGRLLHRHHAGRVRRHVPRAAVRPARRHRPLQHQLHLRRPGERGPRGAPRDAARPPAALTRRRGRPRA